MKFEKEVVSYRKKGEDGKAVTTPLGDCQFKVYETAEEALSDLGEVKMLGILNTQVKTLAMNEFRDANRPGGMSKSALRNQILAGLDVTEWTKKIGEYVAAGKSPQQATDDLVAEKMAEYEAENN